MKLVDKPRINITKSKLIQKVYLFEYITLPSIYLN